MHDTLRGSFPSDLEFSSYPFGSSCLKHYYGGKKKYSKETLVEKTEKQIKKQFVNFLSNAIAIIEQKLASMLAKCYGKNLPFSPKNACSYISLSKDI